MATIITRRRKDGSASYTAQIRLKRAGQVIHQESRTFSRRTLAKEWARRRESELEQPGALDRARAGRTSIGDLIARYIAAMDDLRPLGKTKRQQLEYIARMPVAEVDALRLRVQDLMSHVQERRSRGAGPATTLNDIIFLRVVLQSARALWGVPVDLAPLEDAARQARALSMIGKPQQRHRRPTPEELRRLRDYFAGRDARSEIPMLDIVDFAIASCRRQAEITALRWEDLREDNLTCRVRDLKHPRHRSGHDRWAKLTREAWEIIQRQPRAGDLIFPYNPRSIGTAWQRACRVLGIEDLRFHDIRAEAVCRLFERGYSIPEVALFSLHESWATLQIYARLRAGDVVERG